LRRCAGRVGGVSTGVGTSRLRGHRRVVIGYGGVRCGSSSGGVCGIDPDRSVVAWIAAIGAVSAQDVMPSLGVGRTVLPQASGARRPGLLSRERVVYGARRSVAGARRRWRRELVERAAWRAMAVTPTTRLVGAERSTVMACCRAHASSTAGRRCTSRCATAWRGPGCHKSTRRGSASRASGTGYLLGWRCSRTASTPGVEARAEPPLRAAELKADRPMFAGVRGGVLPVSRPKLCRPYVLLFPPDPALPVAVEVELSIDRRAAA
jgi:hypothetical protein